MGAKTHIATWGSSLAVRIPKPIAKEWGVRDGSAIEIITAGDELVLRKQTYNLEQTAVAGHAGQSARRARNRYCPGRRSVVAKGYVPDWGDIVWMSFSPHGGHEQVGHRPAM